MRWLKLYYGDGCTWTRDDGPWYEAPPDDVQVIVCAGEPHARYLIHGYDHYWSLDGDEIAWADDLGPLMRRALPELPAGWMKFGAHMPASEFERLLSTAADDPDLPAATSPRRRVTDWT